MGTVLYIKDFLRIADVDLLYEGLKELENRIWEEADVQNGMDSIKLSKIEDVRCSILKCLEYVPKEERNDIQLDKSTHS